MFSSDGEYSIVLKQEIEDGQQSLADPAFRADVLNGLAARPRAIPARWFYDRRGSELFEAITALPEYYPTRTETALLEAVGPELGALAADNAAVVEFGSGSSAKTPLLLRAIDPAAYVPIDISGDFLRQSARALGQAFPGLPPGRGRFPAPGAAAAAGGAHAQARLLPRLDDRQHECVAMRWTCCGRCANGWARGAALLIGMDRVKPLDVLDSRL